MQFTTLRFQFRRLIFSSVLYCFVLFCTVHSNAYDDITECAETIFRKSLLFIWCDRNHLKGIVAFLYKWICLFVSSETVVHVFFSCLALLTSDAMCTKLLKTKTKRSTRCIPRTIYQFQFTVANDSKVHVHCQHTHINSLG